MHFKINLTLISVLLIVAFFSIPFYNNWMLTNLLNPNISIPFLADKLDEEQRMVSRFGYSYAVYSQMSKAFKQAKIDSPVLLLPPDSYLKEFKVKDVSVVEPAIFYYFTGEKAVWYNSPEVMKANCALVPDGNAKLVLQRLNSEADLIKLLDIYKKYKID